MTDKKTKTSVKKTQVNINENKYFLEDMSERAKMLLQHCQDLDRKISNISFQMDQMVIGKEAFINLLAKEVETPPEETAKVN